MLTKRSRIAKAAVALSVVAAIAVPGTAYALTPPPPGAASPGGTAGRYGVAALTRDQLKARLRQRIENLLRLRKVKFDFAERRLNERMVRVRGVADKVKAAGGDVTQVNALLDQAADHLERAKADEAKAVGMFKAVPNASDRRAAFEAARAQGRVAVKDLRDARADIRAAIKKLIGVIQSLKGSQQ